MKLAELRPAPYNPKEPSEPGLSRLRWSLSTFGMVEWIIVNGRTGNVVGGNSRREVLIGMGTVEADCLVVDLDADEETSLAVALNNPALQGRFDLGKLAPVLDSIRATKDAALYASSGLEALETIVADAVQRQTEDRDRSQRSSAEKVGMEEAAGVRMLQLHFTRARYEEFLKLVAAAQSALGVDNPSDAVYELLRRWAETRKTFSE
jgi:ParB-like chromosome segregation protein Spo0J